MIDRPPARGGVLENRGSQPSAEADDGRPPALLARFVGPVPASVVVGFGCALVAAVGVAFVVQRSVAERRASEGSVRHTLTVLGRLESTSRLAADLGRGVRGYLVTGQEELLVDRPAIEAALVEAAAALRTLTADNPVQRPQLDALDAALASHVAFQQSLLRTAREAGLDAARELFRGGAGERGFDRLGGVLAEMQAIERRLLEERQAAERAADARVAATLTLLATLLVGLVAGSILLVRHHAVRRERADRRLRRLNVELASRERALTDANAELEAFAYTVSHDLRAPLRHMSGFVELLERSANARLEPEDRRKLAVIAGAARKMGALIDDLLAFSRLGRRELERAPVDLDALVDEVVAGLDGETAGREIEWRRRPLPEVDGDGAMLRQLFVNLVGNAVKFSRGRQPAVIEIGPAEAPPGEVAVVVRDNGAGFDPRHADKLFGVFQRLHRAEEFEGTGVGLAIARRVVLRHGGRIHAESAPDEGAAFHVALPRPAGAIGRAGTGDGRRSVKPADGGIVIANSSGNATNREGGWGA